MPKLLSHETLVGDVLHTWTIQEYDSHERGTLWHILMITSGIVLVVYGIFSSNFLFALIIILFGIIIFLQSYQIAPQVQFAITELGIVIGSRFYSFSEFVDFYMIYNPPHVKTLFLNTRSGFKPLIRIPLLDMDPTEVKYTLREFLDEDFEKEEEPLTDVFARNWKIH
ncbi:MAG: hypothetical protein ABII02_01550 [Candidatus Magasanikbacteria bacterium]